jgi:hypothetical protein
MKLKLLQRPKFCADFSPPFIVERSNDRLIINNELERTRKEVGTINFNVLSGKTEVSHSNCHLRQPVSGPRCANHQVTTSRLSAATEWRVHCVPFINRSLVLSLRNLNTRYETELNMHIACGHDVTSKHTNGLCVDLLTVLNGCMNTVS